MMKVSTGTRILFLLLLNIPLLAQEGTPLTLQEALDATLHDNKQIVLSQLDEQLAVARFRQTNAAFLPQIRVSYTAMSTNNPLNAFGFKLQQQSIGQSDFNPELLNDPSSTQNFMTKAEWLQPILNLDILYMRKAAFQQTDLYAFKSKRTREYLAFEVRKVYAQLQLAHQGQRVLEEGYQTIKSIYTETQNRFQKGFLQKSDVLTVQVQLTQTEKQLAEARSNVRNASDYLSLLMNRPAGTLYTVDPIEEVVTVNDITDKVPNNRADFLAMESAIGAQGAMVNSGKMALVPKLNAFAEYLINDSEALGFGSDSYLIGAQLSWTLFNGMASRQRIAESRIERSKLEEQLHFQKEQGQLQVNKSVRLLEDLRIGLEQSKQAVELSAEALRITQNRFQQGLASTNDVLHAQTLHAQQKLSQAQSYYEFNTVYAELQYLTSASEN